MFGMQDLNADYMATKLEDTLPVIRQVSEQFKNPVSVRTLNSIHTIVVIIFVHTLNERTKLLKDGE